MTKLQRVVGVEIEMCGDYLNREYGNPYLYRSSSGASVKLEPGWKYSADPSCGIEFISPPLVDLESIHRMVANIKSSGLNQNFNKSGLHVHVGVWDFSDTDVENMAKFCRHFDRAIFSFMAPHRLADKFCRPVAMSNRDISAAKNSGFRNIERYKGCNTQAYAEKGTIEFRYSESTLDVERIEALIDFYTKICDFVKMNSGAKVNSPRKTEDKRIFLLDLIGVAHATKIKLLSVKYQKPQKPHKFKVGDIVLLSNGLLGRIQEVKPARCRIEVTYSSYSTIASKRGLTPIYGPMQTFAEKNEIYRLYEGNVTPGCDCITCEARTKAREALRVAFSV